MKEVLNGKKLYTGWQGDIGREYGDNKSEITENEASQKDLSIKFLNTKRGRSSAIFVFEDKDGFEYDLTMSAVGEILKNHLPQIKSKFIQKKQGQSYTIFPVVK